MLSSRSGGMSATAARSLRASNEQVRLLSITDALVGTYNLYSRHLGARVLKAVTPSL
jgi:hypothetical protein